jgi:hypothetical protein
MEGAIESLGFQYCYEGLAEYCSTLLLFWIKEAGPFGDEGFQDAGFAIARRCNASNFTTPTTNENFYRFS